LLGLLIAAIVYQSTAVLLGPQSRQIPVSLKLGPAAQELIQPVENGVGGAATLFVAFTILPAERLVTVARAPRKQPVPAIRPTPQPSTIVLPTPGPEAVDQPAGNAHPRHPDHRSTVAQVHKHQLIV
jgi:hypothetical protein